MKPKDQVKELLEQGKSRAEIQKKLQQTADNCKSCRQIDTYIADAKAEIEAEVAKLEQSEKGSNVRFTDFRIPQAATIVLREANGPLHVSEIYRRLSAGGFEFRGQHQLITLAVSLSRSKRFHKVSPGTFDLNPDYRESQVA